MNLLAGTDVTRTHIGQATSNINTNTIMQMLLMNLQGKNMKDVSLANNNTPLFSKLSF